MNKTFAIFGLLLAFGLSFAIAPANTWSAVLNDTKYNWSSGFLTNETTEGGNVTQMNMGINLSTEKWAGYWGNLSGRMVLAPNATSTFYTWAWDSTKGGEVCAVAAASGFSWTTAYAVTKANVDAVWGFTGTDLDSANNTLLGTCTLNVSGVAVTGSVGNFTGVGTAFRTCAIGDGDAYTVGLKQNLAFCVNITNSGSLFNGQKGDYELLVPTNETAASTETYYFWMELS